MYDLQDIKAIKSRPGPLECRIRNDVVKTPIRCSRNKLGGFLRMILHQPNLNLRQTIPPHLQCLIVGSVCFDDMYIFPRKFGSDFGLNSRFVAYQSKDCIGWIFRKLTKKPKLHRRLRYAPMLRQDIDITHPQATRHSCNHVRRHRCVRVRLFLSSSKVDEGNLIYW